MTDNVVPDGPIITNLSDVKPLSAEESETRQRDWIKKKWKRALNGVDGLTFDCPECGEKFLFNQRDKRWRNQILGDLIRSRNCLDCRDKED